jgi:hypothetical protein
MKVKFAFLISLSILITLSQNAFSQSIALNEIMASNATVIADEDGDFGDWIELYNYGSEPISLLGFGLSDNYDNPYKWTFPNVVINPNQYLLVWASGKNRTNPDSPLHTGYSISAAGEEVILTNPSGELIDEIAPISIPTNYSYGRFPNGTGELRFFTSSTPGFENIGPGYGFLVDPPNFSHPDGTYTSSIELALSTSQADAQIYYTLDGSEPNVNSALYQGPIPITSRVGTPNSISLIPTNNISETGPPYYEGWQPPLGEVYKISIVRAKVFHPDAPPSSTATYSYMIDPLGSNRYSLPFFSLSTNSENFFDNEIGIYVHGNHPDINYFQSGMEWERPVNITFFEKGGNLGFKEDVGVRLHGNTTRSRPRKSLRISSRSEYGNSWINYKLFPDKNVTTFKRFILRNSGNDWDWSIFRDAFIQHLAKDLNVETQYYRPSILFINGEYWGIHNIRDRYDENYILSHYGVEENDMTILENNSEFKFGNQLGVDHYNNMRSFIASNNMALSTNYESVKTMMDVESFIDFQLTHIFSMNTDWPGNNTLYWRFNREGYDPSAPMGRDGRWRWFILDTDFGFNLPFFYVPGVNEGAAHNTLAFATETNGPSWPNPDWSTFLLRKLLENQEFRNKFINRYSDLLNSTFCSKHVVSVIDSISNVLEPEMQEHLNRWRRPTSIAEWNGNINVLRDFAQQRPAYQFQHLRQKFGLSSTTNVTLNVSNSIYGFIRINSIDINPNTMGIGNNPYPWTGSYFIGMPIEVKAIATPGYQFSHWSGASSSTNPTLSINLTGEISLTAHFTKTDDPQLVHFWFFGNNIINDTPLETLDVNYSLLPGSYVEYHSALVGYPFQSGHPNWRKASMERRNSPTSINYLPLGNNNIPFESANMRAIQIKQPFTADGGENSLIVHTPSKGFENIKFRFAAKDEGAASGLVVDYSIDNDQNLWITDNLITTDLSLTVDYKLFEVDLSNIPGANNNAKLKIRIRFYGDNLALDLGNRVTFNNFSVEGVSLTAYTVNVTHGSNGSIEPSGTVSMYQGASKTFTVTPKAGFKIQDVLVDNVSIIDNLQVDNEGVGLYHFNAIESNHSLHATFSSSTSIPPINSSLSMQIYPNPASNFISIVSEFPMQRVEIVNVLGKYVYRGIDTDRVHDVSVSNFAKGIYIVRVITSKGIASSRLIIE